MKTFNTSNNNSYAEFTSFVNNKVYSYLKTGRNYFTGDTFYFIINNTKFKVVVPDFYSFTVSVRGNKGYEAFCTKKIRSNQHIDNVLYRALMDIYKSEDEAQFMSELEANTLVEEEKATVETEEVTADITTEWTKFAKNYAEASADAMDVTDGYRESERVLNFEEDYDSAMHSFISMKNLEMGEETNKYLEEAYSISDFVKHYYSYALEKDYIIDYDFDCNRNIRVVTIDEVNEGFREFLEEDIEEVISSSREEAWENSKMDDAIYDEEEIFSDVSKDFNEEELFVYWVNDVYDIDEERARKIYKSSSVFPYDLSDIYEDCGDEIESVHWENHQYLVITHIFDNPDYNPVDVDRIIDAIWSIFSGCNVAETYEIGGGWVLKFCNCNSENIWDWGVSLGKIDVGEFEEETYFLIRDYCDGFVDMLEKGSDIVENMADDIEEYTDEYDG